MKDAKKLLTEFLRATEDQVLAAFAKVPNSWRSKKGEWVYLPGKREDRVLLVAHADTVRWKDKEPVDLMWIGDVVTVAGQKDNALGGDDRAGCAMMLDLWDGSHSVLITTGEERGCTGSRAALRDIQNELSKHQFAVQVDRRGNRQAVFYDVATREFRDYMVSELSRFDYEKVAWREHQGSCTDIKVLCPAIGICGVNLSAGYYNEHSDNEMVVLGSWLHTRTALRRILKQEKLERFELQKHQGFIRGLVGETTHGISTTGSLTQTEEPEIVIPEGSLSKRQQKKLTKKIRAAYVGGRIKRIIAWGMLQRLYKDLSYGDLSELISKVLPFGNSVYPSESNSVVICMECHNSVEHHKFSCTKSVRAKMLNPGSANEQCSVCGAFIKWGHFKGCTAHTGTRLLVAEGELKIATQCEECTSFAGHYPSCSFATPVEKVEKCEECRVDILLGHLPSCSKSGATLNSHVRGRSLETVVLGGQPKKCLELITCFHDCIICRIEDKRNGSWSHIKPQSGKCTLYIQAPCPGHSRDTIKQVSVYEQEVQKLRNALS